MTALYRPVLIETAEQAERLPVGAIAMTEDVYQVSRKIEDDGAWQRTDLIDDLGWDEDMIGWTALVPVEAEEETVVAIGPGNPYADASMDSDGNVWFGDGLSRVDVTEEFNEWASKNQRTRYVTPWESA